MCTVYKLQNSNFFCADSVQSRGGELYVSSFYHQGYWHYQWFVFVTNLNWTGKAVCWRGQRNLTFYNSDNINIWRDSKDMQQPIIQISTGKPSPILNNEQWFSSVCLFGITKISATEEILYDSFRNIRMLQKIFHTSFIKVLRKYFRWLFFLSFFFI